MQTNDNSVYATALQLSGRSKEATPEIVILGYAKLLSMDEKQVEALISKDALEDLESAHQWFARHKLCLPRLLLENQESISFRLRQPDFRISMSVRAKRTFVGCSKGQKALFCPGCDKLRRRG